MRESLAPIKLKSEPRKWKYCQSLKKERNEKREAGSTSLPLNMRSVFSKDSANGRAERLLREDIRQRYLQRIGRGNKPGQKSTHLFHVCIAAVKSSKNNNLAPMSPSNRCIRKITEKSSDLDIYEYLSSPEKLYLPKKDKTLEQSLTAKHRDLMAPLSHSYTDLEGDKGDPLMEGILAFRISRDLRLLENSEHENTVTKTAPALDSSALADEKKAKSQSSQFLLDIGRAKRALHFSFTGSLPPSHSSASNPDRISRSSSSSHQRSNEGGMASSTLDVSFEQQRAQDRLLVSQVHRGVIPIQLFRSSSSSSSSCCALDIPNFSIGDDHGLCIGESLAGFDSIQSINISNNRLSCVSLPQIISQISTKSLLFLDISSNKLGDKGCRALSSFFQLPNALSNLNISSCLLSNSNLSRLFSALGSRKQTLVGLNISSNAINIEGTESIKRYLMTDLCSMQSLNLSWNELGSGGGKLIAEALKKNTSLLSLDLSANGIPDDAGQIIISHLSSPTCTLQDLNLSRNKIGSRTCFVLAKICRHRMNALQKINLSCNPLGEPGARVLLREALSGTSLQILLHDVAVDIDDSAFNYSHPELKSPYDLNLLDAYDAAVLDELITMSKRNSSTKFEHVASRDTLKTPFEINIHLLTVNEEVVVKSSLQKWIPPSIGYIRINFSHRIRVPSLAMAVPASSFATLLEIIIQAPSAADRNKFMRLIFMDIFCTTAHLQTFLSSLKRAKLLRSGKIIKICFKVQFKHCVKAKYRSLMCF